MFGADVGPAMGGMNAASSSSLFAMIDEGALGGDCQALKGKGKSKGKGDGKGKEGKVTKAAKEVSEPIEAARLFRKLQVGPHVMGLVGIDLCGHRCNPKP